MNLVDEVFSSLDNWGKTPVMVEIPQQGEPAPVNSEQFRNQVQQYSSQFVQMGVTPKSLVPLFLNNSADFPLIFLALIKAGAIPVMVKTDYRHIELTEIFSNADPKVVVTEKNHLPVIAPWLQDCTVIVRDTAGLSVIQRREDTVPGVELPEDVATINYTYRGYGYPLGSMARHSQYINGADVLQMGLQGEPGERMLVILPMAHIFTLIGCLMVPLRYKLTGLISLSMNPRRIFSTIRDWEANYLLSVPEIYELITRVRSKDSTFPTLKAFVSGGSYLSPEKYEEYSKAFNVEVLHGYGLTEYTPASRNIRGNARPGTIGPLCPGVGCVFDDGEILLDTPHISHGYYRRPTETADAFKGRLFRTGDMGSMNNGHLVFEREKKRTRKINGNMIDLSEVERAIGCYPRVDRFHVKFDHAALTAEVAFKGRGETREEVESLRSYLIANIARYKVPRIITGADI